MDVRDKVVIITGASEGIGAAIARAFADAGAKLILAARSVEKLTAVAGGLPAETETLVVPTDVTHRDEVRALIERADEHFGTIDILINNAGQGAVGAVATVDPDDYRAILELNLLGPLHAMQAVVPKMRAQGGGVIINISSSVSKMAIPGMGAYASTKYALNGLSLTARNELAVDNIRVVLFYPGVTATDFGKNTLGDVAQVQQQFRDQFGDQPMSEPDSADDVALKVLQATIEEPAEAGMPAQT